MVSDAEILDAMAEERNGLRREIIQMQRAMEAALFAFVTVAAVVAGIVWQGDLPEDQAVRAIIVFCLSQVEFILAIFVVMVLTNQMVHSGYVAGLEEAMNAIAGRKIAVWETVVVKRFLLDFRSGYSWGSTAIVLFFLCTFIMLIVAAFDVIDSFGAGVLVTVEFIVTLVCLIRVPFERESAAKHTADLLVPPNGPTGP